MTTLRERIAALIARQLEPLEQAAESDGLSDKQLDQLDTLARVAKTAATLPDPPAPPAERPALTDDQLVAELRERRLH